MRGVTVLCAVALLGCAEVRRHPPTMGAEQPLTGGEAIALANELQAAFEPITDPDQQAMCAQTLPQRHDAENLTVLRYTGNPRRAPQQFRCVRYRKPDATHTVERHVQAGMGLTDLYCDDFFRRVASHSSSRRFSRGVVNDVGAAISAVLGLTNTTSAVTGGVGLGFGLVDGGFRNYDDAFLVSADLSTLQSKVYAEQDKFRAAIEPRLSTLQSYPRGNSLILRYANLCSYTGMRQLINNALVETTSPTMSLERTLASLKSLFANVRAARALSQEFGNATGNGTDDVMETAGENVMEGSGNHVTPAANIDMM